MIMDICLLVLLSYDSFYSSRNVKCNLVKSQLISVIFLMIPFCGYQKNFGDRICNTGINKE